MYTQVFLVYPQCSGVPPGVPTPVWPHRPFTRPRSERRSRPRRDSYVDELFIELHFFAPSLNWVHLTHSMKQAFDVLRELRACGLPVHAWP